jgi:hypothetical protein
MRYFSGEEIVALSVKTGQSVDKLLRIIGERVQPLRVAVRQGNPPTPD